jgi:hypothetical protein
VAGLREFSLAHRHLYHPYTNMPYWGRQRLRFLMLQGCTCSAGRCAGHPPRPWHLSTSKNGPGFQQPLASEIPSHRCAWQNGPKPPPTALRAKRVCRTGQVGALTAFAANDTDEVLLFISLRLLLGGRAEGPPDCLPIP